MAKSAIQTQIEDDAAAAAETNVDGTHTKEHPLPDKIAADKYTRSTQALRNPGAGVVFSKIVPHGSVQ